MYLFWEEFFSFIHIAFVITRHGIYTQIDDRINCCYRNVKQKEFISFAGLLQVNYLSKRSGLIKYRLNHNN